ncbi:MAG: hypothetical protein K2X38_05610 [Gemmataceae bacterium]|nr:hypothetical protein [Gemmataceae bacterium]
MAPASQIEPITQARKDSSDLQIRQIQKEIRFDTRDFPIETIVKRFQNGNFSIPTYQRELIWTSYDQSQFSESVIIGLPIPMMFLAVCGRRPAESNR